MPGATPHRVDTHIDFGGDNRDQPFQLLAHTREDGLLGGVTSWGGKDWPVEGRMSQNLYTIAQDGALRWYRHTGRSQLGFQWDDAKVVGSGWHSFRAVFGGGDGVVYAIQPDGVLLWYYHDGRNQGTFDWQGAKQVGTGWQSFRQVFAGDGGVIYGMHQRRQVGVVPPPRPARRQLPLAGAVPGRHRLEQLHDGHRRAGRLPLRHPSRRCVTVVPPLWS